MTTIQNILLGIVQGLAEFLPISSSGHLLLLRSALGVNDATGTYIIFDILLHVGTLFVVLIAFWKDWLNILKNPFKSKTLLLLFIASLPALLAVVGLGKIIDIFETGRFLGCSFIVSGLLLILSEKQSKNNISKEEVNYKHAISMGISQILGLLPGISRSGSTIFGGIMTGLDKKKAAKFSFMMSAPAIVGSLLYEGKKAIEQGYLAQLNLLPTLLGMIAAAISGWIAIHYMLKLIHKVSLHWFSIYLFALGIVVIILQLLGAGALPKMF